VKTKAFLVCDVIGIIALQGITLSSSFPVPLLPPRHVPPQCSIPWRGAAGRAQMSSLHFSVVSPSEGGLSMMPFLYCVTPIPQCGREQPHIQFKHSSASRSSVFSSSHSLTLIQLHLPILSPYQGTLTVLISLSELAQHLSIDLRVATELGRSSVLR
jgi:hypothetical protein